VSSKRGDTYTLQLRVQGDAVPGALEIVLPAVVYRRWKLTSGATVHVALRQRALYVMAGSALAPGGEPATI